MTSQELKEYNAKRRREKAETYLTVLSKFEKGVDKSVIHDFVKETMHHYIAEHIDNFSRDKSITFSIPNLSITGVFNLDLKINGADEFTKVFNKCIIITFIDVARETHEKKLQSIKHLDINNEKDRAILKQWADDNYYEAMSINNVLIEDKPKKEEDNNLLVLHKSEERTIVVDYSLFQSGLDFSDKVLDIWFETC